MRKFIYDWGRYPFLEIVTEILNQGPLWKLHEKANYTLFSRENDQSTEFHKKFYDNFEKLRPTYEAFIENDVRNSFQEEIIYQTIPTFRVHLNGNVAVGEFHKDSDYSHPVTEINFFIPFTDAFGNNTIWVESAPGKGDYSPMECLYSEGYMWSGSILRHGNHLNDSGYTRVSMDFRVITETNYIESGGETINTHMPFKIGGYYSSTRR